jgi:hypothetical protein
LPSVEDLSPPPPVANVWPMPQIFIDIDNED